MDFEGSADHRLHATDAGPFAANFFLETAEIGISSLYISCNRVVRHGWERQSHHLDGRFKRSITDVKKRGYEECYAPQLLKLLVPLNI